MFRKVVFINALSYDIDIIPTDELTTCDEYAVIARYDDDRYVVTYNRDYFHIGFVIFFCAFLALALYGFLFGGGKS